jgi:hypothetical protein
MVTFDASTGLCGSVHVSTLTDSDTPISIRVRDDEFQVDFSRFTNVENVYIGHTTIDLGCGLLPLKCKKLTLSCCEIHVSKRPGLTVETLEMCGGIRISDTDAFRKAFKLVNWYMDYDTKHDHHEYIPYRVQYIHLYHPVRVWTFAEFLKSRPLLRGTNIIIYSFYEFNYLVKLANTYRGITYDQCWRDSLRIDRNGFCVCEDQNIHGFDLQKIKADPRKVLDEYFQERHYRLLYGSIQCAVETQHKLPNLTDIMHIVRQFVGETNFGNRPV